jgi:hypothetical protein
MVAVTDSTDKATQTAAVAQVAPYTELVATAQDLVAALALLAVRVEDLALALPVVVIRQSAQAVAVVRMAAVVRVQSMAVMRLVAHWLALRAAGLVVEMQQRPDQELAVETAVEI